MLLFAYSTFQVPSIYPKSSRLHICWFCLEYVWNLKWGVKYFWQNLSRLLGGSAIFSWGQCWCYLWPWWGKRWFCSKRGYRSVKTCTIRGCQYWYTTDNIDTLLHDCESWKYTVIRRWLTLAGPIFSYLQLTSFLQLASSSLVTKLPSLQKSQSLLFLSKKSIQNCPPWPIEFDFQ